MLQGPVFMANTYYVYILASKRNGTLYIGMTNNLERRIYEHKNYIYTALQREKQLKTWNRKWKLSLIERVNPDWNDIAKDWIPDKGIRE